MPLAQPTAARLANVQALQRVAKSAGVSANDLLLAALATVAARHFNEHHLALHAADGPAREIEVAWETPFSALAHRLAQAAGKPVDTAQAPLPSIAMFWGADAASAAANASADVVLHAVIEGKHCQLSFAADPARLPANAVERFAAHYVELVTAALDAVDTPIGNLRMIGADERKTVLGWSGAGEHFPAEHSLAALFEAQAARTPDAVAVTCGADHLTYAQLNARANRLAHLLRAKGVGVEMIVGLFLDRSLDLAVGLLGILKAGAAYLPMDLAYPPERLKFMVEDSGVGIVVASTRTSEALELAGIETLLLDRDNAAIEQCDANNPAPLAGPANRAYVIYTSGSTGKPKGCEVTHANVARLFTATHAWFGFSGTDVWTMFHSHAFDFSVWEIWGAWLYGGRLVIVPHEVSRSPELFLDLLRDERVTVLNQTPSAFKQLIAAATARTPAAPLALRYVVFGGEALELQSLRPWVDLYGDDAPHLINMYGITETTVHVTYRPIRRADIERGAGSVIGRAIPDLRLYVLDPSLQPCPIGVVGEMFVAGAGVSRGYLNRAELTAQRFIDWASEPGAPTQRLYRSGDLARWLEDGDLEYLGRIDHQVKIRGFRIEIGEIESALARHPAIASCAVIARNDGGKEARLVAYLVARDHAPTHGDLRAYLKTTMPDYMVPSAFVSLAALPITENGKLDRRALPAPERARPELSEPYREPETADEAACCAAFAQVLQLEKVGRLDNFFELGGDSLRAVQAVDEISAALGQRVSTPTIFAAPTPETLARAIAQSQRAPQIAAFARNGNADEPIAIVGMAGRFPGAADVETFWANLLAGRDSITHFDRAALDPSIPAALRDDPSYVAARGIIDGVEFFDAGFFGIPPREAELIDPQHRLFLELCWECLERAGHCPDNTELPVGVFGGVYGTTYLQQHVLHHPDKIERVGDFNVMLGNEKDFVATRVAHKLNLTGPAISLHTACSTSLVAIAQAVDHLRSEEHTSELQSH